MTPSLSEDLSVLRGAGYFHDLRYNGNINVSMAGGSIIRFSADSGFDDEPINNKVQLRNHDIFSNWITIQGHDMDGKKIEYLFQSNSLAYAILISF